MTSTINELDNHQKELCAVAVMRSMLEDYSVDMGIAFKEALFRFASSDTYNMLFDFSTGLWREGPDYLRNIFVKTKPEDQIL
jgi:hypothetical protein